MSDTSMSSRVKDRPRELLDWAVFSIGVLSLATAIGATALSKSNVASFDATTTAPAEVVSG